MTEYHNFKVGIWPHTIESTEDLLVRTQLFLGQLAVRSKAEAINLGELDVLSEKRIKETSELLFELDHALTFVALALEGEKDHLYGIRIEAVDCYKKKAD